MLKYAAISSMVICFGVYTTSCGSMDSATRQSMAGLGVNTLINATKNGGLTQADITAGLKEALNIGVQMGVKKLSAKNGYYNDLAVKIGLPSQANVIVNNISKIALGKDMVDKVVKGINEAATDAVGQTVPIFATAIKDMTIQDAVGILKGKNTAASDYFKTKTKTGLKKVFGGYIGKSVNKKLIGDFSAQSAWDGLTSTWNEYATTTVGRIAGMKTVNVDLTDHLTDKAIDGLYLKVGEQETKIRTQASARTTELLRKVFGR